MDGNPDFSKWVNNGELLQTLNIEIRPPSPPMVSSFSFNMSVGRKNDPSRIIRLLPFSNEEANSIYDKSNLIYPYFSLRKVEKYSEEIGIKQASSVGSNLVNLPAKIDRICDSGFEPAHSKYNNACKKILGFVPTSKPSPGGKSVGYGIQNLEQISLSSMGEGIPSLLGLIVNLCLAENKIFIIEEPENDLHPTALKALLDFVIETSENNQFFISTHSNIVLKHLGATQDSKCFEVSKKHFDEHRSRMELSSVRLVENNPDDKLRVLESLGYEFLDSSTWDGWLFFEESSAESIVREFLIPKFVPELMGRVRTYACKSVSEVPQKFERFNELFVFLNLEKGYKNRAWVLIDGNGESKSEEEKIIRKLKDIYSSGHGWEENRFQQLRHHDFEEYYPPAFRDEFNKIKAEAMNMTGKQKKQFKKEKKLHLLQQVISWTRTNSEDAKKEFETSAQEIIDWLRMIKNSIESKEA